MSVIVDISEDGSDEVLVENTHGFSYAITAGDFTLEVRFEQAQSLYAKLKGYFDEE